MHRDSDVEACHVALTSWFAGWLGALGELRGIRPCVPLPRGSSWKLRRAVVILDEQDSRLLHDEATRSPRSPLGASQAVTG